MNAFHEMDLRRVQAHRLSANERNQFFKTCGATNRLRRDASLN